MSESTPLGPDWELKKLRLALARGSSRIYYWSNSTSGLVGFDLSLVGFDRHERASRPPSSGRLGPPIGRLASPRRTSGPRDVARREGDSPSGRRRPAAGWQYARSTPTVPAQSLRCPSTLA